jgi:hypothetical protein
MKIHDFGEIKVVSRSGAIQRQDTTGMYSPRVTVVTVSHQMKEKIQVTSQKHLRA